MKKKKANSPTSNKNNKVVFILLSLFGFIIFVYVFNIPFPFRYKITGTNQGIIYKTDRFTGKTYVVTPYGEKLIEETQEPSPNPAPESFPLGQLTILNLDSTNSDLYSGQTQIFGSIKNTSLRETACHVMIKIVFKKSENGDDIDTKTGSLGNYFGPNTTAEFSYPLFVPNQLKNRKFWYNVQIIKAEKC